MLFHKENHDDTTCNKCILAMLFLVPLLAMALTFFIAIN